MDDTPETGQPEPADMDDPNCFVCGDSVVRIRFDENGGDLRSHLKNYFISCKQA